MFNSHRLRIRGLSFPALAVPAIVLLLLAVSATVSPAHLSIIRQGPESRGAYEAGDRHGQALAAGDFNGDGYEDIAMGSPFEDISGGINNGGAVVVSFGSEHGITEVGALIFTEAILGFSDETNAQFGYSLTAADFNLDGRDDLVIGVPGSSLGTGLSSVGKAYVLRGDAAQGLVYWQTLQQPNAGGSNEEFDRFGSSMVVGHFDGLNPARPDLVIGASGEDSGAGAVFYFMGGAGGVFGPTGFFKQSSLGETNDAGDGFGTSLATGDLIGDGGDDLVIGTPYDDSFFINQGAVYVIPALGNGGLSAAGAIQLDAWMVDAPATNDYFGYAVAMGELMSAPDGKESLAVGAPGRTFEGVVNAGRVTIFPGSIAGIDQQLDRNLFEYMVNGGTFTGDRFGWTLAAGYFDTPNEHEDLAIGSPYDGLGQGTPTGVVHVAFGGAQGPGAHGFAGFNQGSLNDPVTGGEDLGVSLVYGDFDGTGHGSLAAGAPGNDDDAGMVHIIAPWRQVYDLQCRSSAVLDCDGSLIFSQKPFEQVSIASTTKILTVLMACVRASLPPGDQFYLDLEELHDIPDWVVFNVGGSQVPLLQGERMSLRNLLKTCLLVSGNDAAYMIGDIMVGKLGPAGIPTVAGIMNNHAASLGMTRSSFHNAAGLDNEVVSPNPPTTGHYSTAEDMVRLGRAAMQNGIFRDIAGESSMSITRFFAGGPSTWNCNNIINWILENPNVPEGNGIKSGWTPNANYTAVISGGVPFDGDAVSGIFGSPTDLGNEVARQNAIDVLGLGLDECGMDYVTIFEDRFNFWLPDARTLLGEVASGSAQFSGLVGRDMVVELCRQSGEDATLADLEIRRFSNIGLEPSDRELYRITPFEEHGELRFQNLGDATVNFRVILDYDSNPVAFELVPGAIGTIPAYGGPDTNGGGFLLENLTPGDIQLSVEEHYAFRGVDIPAGACAGPAFSANIERGYRTSGDVFEVRILGRDSSGGSSLVAVAHDGDTVVDVDTPVFPAGEAGSGLSLSIPSPNPFLMGPGRSARIGFELSTAEPVRISVYDTAGRRVRVFPETSPVVGRGMIEWEGRDDAGRPVPAGIYLIRAQVPSGGHASGRLVLLR